MMPVAGASGQTLPLLRGMSCRMAVAVGSDSVASSVSALRVSHLCHRPAREGRKGVISSLSCRGVGVSLSARCCPDAPLRVPDPSLGICGLVPYAMSVRYLDVSISRQRAQHSGSYEAPRNAYAGLPSGLVGARTQSILKLGRSPMYSGLAPCGPCYHHRMGRC